MEEWHKGHSGVANDPAWAEFLNDVRQQLDDKWDELQEEHDNGGLFGMSKAGGCTTASQLKMLGHEGEDLSGSTRVTFFIGHLCEVIGVASLRAVGVGVHGSQHPIIIPGVMHSYTDGLITYSDIFEMDDEEVIPLSVKSTGYKKSGRERRGKEYQWVRRGFPELPFEGMRTAQPGHWAQCQAEMHGLALDGNNVQRSLYLVVAKDIVKAMEGDPYLGDNEGGNGSLTFYTEWVDYNPQWCEQVLVPTWSQALAEAQGGRIGAPKFLPKASNNYATLEQASLNWMPNAERTGTYNPCAYCDLQSACQSQKR